MKYQLDFHCHSIASDGGKTIPQLAELAKTAGLGALIVTDHCYSHGSFYANKNMMYTFNKMGIKFPVPVIIGCEICTPFGEFLLFGAKAIANWHYVRDHLKKVNEMFGMTTYWKLFFDHVCCGSSWSGGGIDDFGTMLRDKEIGSELPYAMIVCHPACAADRYAEFPDAMYKILHGFEVGNSGVDWRDDKITNEVVEVLKYRIKNPRMLTNSDCHGDDIGKMQNTVEIPDGKPLDEGNLIKWLRNRK